MKSSTIFFFLGLTAIMAGCLYLITYHIDVLFPVLSLLVGWDMVKMSEKIRRNKEDE